VAQVREDMGAKRGEPVGRIVIALPPSISRQRGCRVVAPVRPLAGKAKARSVR